MEHTFEREEALMQTYFSLLSSKAHIIPSEIYREVAAAPSPRFWVSDTRTAVVLAKLETGGDLGRMLPLKREMFLELHRRFRAARGKDSKSSNIELITQIISQPAPCFYLTPGTVKVMVCKLKKKWFMRKNQRLRH